ncbi:hypothetical protein BJX70DRAFT_219757 [Aspergillus crustosus]
MWVLIFFIAVSAVMLLDASLPMSAIHDSGEKLSDEELQLLSNDTSRLSLIAADTSSQTSGAGDLVRDALEPSIRAQEKSLARGTKSLVGFVECPTICLLACTPIPIYLVFHTSTC